MEKYTRSIRSDFSIYIINENSKKGSIMFRTINAHNKRAIHHGQIGKISIEQANIALRYFNYRCAFSGERFVDFNNKIEKKVMYSLSLEHIIPIVAGGNSLAYNCVPSILQYNLRKHAHHPLDWWGKQKNIAGNEIFNPIRLLKLVNYILKSLKGFEEKDIKKYRKIIMEQNEVDRYINKNKKSLISEVCTGYIVKDSKLVRQEVPYNVKIPKLTNKKIKYEQIKLDLFILDCINLLQEYKIPNNIIEYLKNEFKRLKEIEEIFKKIPEEERIQRELIEYLRKNKIQNIYTVARTINLKEILKRKININEYIEEKLKDVYEELKKNRIDKEKINFILDNNPRIIESKEEQEIIIQMIINFKKQKNNNIKEYFSKIENITEAEDIVFVRKIMKTVKHTIKYLSYEEINKLRKRLEYNALCDRKFGRRLKKVYESLYQELKKRGIKEPELSIEASKAYIYSKVGTDGFSSIQDNDKYAIQVKENVLKNYKRGILELDFYLLENKQDKSVIEADKELTKEVLSRLHHFLEKLDTDEFKILKRKLEYNSGTCIKHGTRLINVYNRIYYALKNKEIKEPELSIEASKAYICCKICKMGFYSIQTNEAKHKSKSIEKVIKNYKKEFKDIGYYLLDNKTNISKQQADKELTEFILQNTKEITNKLNEQEKIMLRNQLMRNYNYYDNKSRRLIVAYNKIYYELKIRGEKEPKLSIEASKAYVYAKIAQVGFTNILSKERNSIKDNIQKVLEQYENGLKNLDFYILNNRVNKNIEQLDEKFTEKILLHTKGVLEKLSIKEQSKLRKILLKNPYAKGIKLINAFNRIYCEMKSKELKEPQLTQETCKAYIYAKVSELGFSSLLTNDSKYTNKNLKRLLNEYQENIEDIGYYLLDNKCNKSVVEADREITEEILNNIKEITNKLDKNQMKLLREKLLFNAKSNVSNGVRLVNVYNRIYYTMKKNGIEEPKLSVEASKAYVFSKIFNIGFNDILKGSNKIFHIKHILNCYEIKLKEIDYYLLRDTKKKNVKEDDEKLTEYILKNTKFIISKLAEEEKQKLQKKLLYNHKYNLNQGIKQRNAFNRIFCAMKSKGLTEPQLTEETCKAYIYAKVGPISFESIVTHDKNRTDINLEKIIKNYKEGIEKIDYYLLRDSKKKNVKEDDEKLTEYVIEKAKDSLKNLTKEEKYILKQKLLYSMRSHIKHGIRLKNAFEQIKYVLKKEGVVEPHLSIEASKAYIYTKIMSNYFSSIIQNNKKYIEKNLKNIINEYKEKIEKLECYLLVNNKLNDIYDENIKLVEYILLNTEDILDNLTAEEMKKIKYKMLRKSNKNRYMPVFFKIYNEISKKETNKTEIIKKTCRAYLYGVIGTIGFNSILNNEKEYGNKNLKKIIEETDEGIKLLDYYLLYDRNKQIKEENIELSEKIYLEINRYFSNLTLNQKQILMKKLLKNSDKELRFINVYNKIYYTFKKLNIEEPKLTINSKRIYAYIKLTEKGFDLLGKNKTYSNNYLSESKLKEYSNKFEELDFYLLEVYEDKELKEADQILTKKVLEKSGILNKLNNTEIKYITNILLKNSSKNVKLVTVYNRIYYELSKSELQEEELIKEASKAYIYAKIARRGFTAIQYNTKTVKKKIQRVITEYSKNIKDIRLYIIKNINSRDKTDEFFTNIILENSKDILKVLNQEERKKIKQKLIHNANKGVKLINVYYKIYYELMKKGFNEPELTKEATKAYIYAKVGPDGFCDIRDNTKNAQRILEKIINNYSSGIKKIKYYLLDFFEDKNVYEADKILINNILLETKNELGELCNDINFIKRLGYNSQNKSKMIIVYNKIFFELLKSGIKEPKLTIETNKAFIYAKIGPEGFKQIQNNNKGSDEYVLNVIKYYKHGLEIIKNDYNNNNIDFTKRVLYKKDTIRKK